MRTVMRTFFNVVYQPWRVGKRRTKVGLSKFIPVPTYAMQRTRRAHQGRRNRIIGTHANIKAYIRALKSNRAKYVSRSYMLRRVA